MVYVLRATFSSRNLFSSSLYAAGYSRRRRRIHHLFMASLTGASQLLGIMYRRQQQQQQQQEEAREEKAAAARERRISREQQVVSLGGGGGEGSEADDYTPRARARAILVPIETLFGFGAVTLFFLRLVRAVVLNVATFGHASPIFSSFLLAPIFFAFLTFKKD